jgi:hypothetical protein
VFIVHIPLRLIFDIKVEALQRSLAVTMKWTALFALMLLSQDAAAQTSLNYPCSQLVIGFGPEGRVLSQVVGGNGFNTSRPTSQWDDYATCTSCSVAQDRSNYWTPVLFFGRRDGKWKRVPQIGSPGFPSKGGFVVHYSTAGYAGGGGSRPSAFPPVSYLDWRQL